jgi:hypothetical protein
MNKSSLLLLSTRINEFLARGDETSEENSVPMRVSEPE